MPSTSIQFTSVLFIFIYITSNSYPSHHMISCEQALGDRGKEKTPLTGSNLQQKQDQGGAGPSAAEGWGDGEETGQRQCGRDS